MTESAIDFSVEAIVGIHEKLPLRVLHIDDEIDFLKVAKRCLELQGGFQVDAASSVEEAAEKMLKSTYDVIVSDYRMQRKDGLQFLKELRDGGNKIPFIMFTGKGREEVAIQALNLGADRYISKVGAPETVYAELAHSIKSIVKAKKAEEEFTRREMRYRSLVENTGVGIITVSPKGEFTFVNDGICKIIGYSEREMLGKSFTDFIHPDDKERVLQNFQGMLQSKELKTGFEFRVMHKAGGILHLYAHPTLFIYNGEIVGSHSIIIDITERKRIEEALKESEEKYRNMVEDAPDLIVTVDEKGVVTSCNSAVEKGSGYSKDEVIGKSFWEPPLTRIVDTAHAQSLFSSIMEGKLLEPIEITWLQKGGATRLSEIRVNLMRKEGRPVGFTAIARDITERKRMEEELAKSEEKYRNLVELAPDSILTFDLKGVVTSCNTASTTLSGYFKDELVGKHFWKIGPVRVRDIPKYFTMFYSTVRGRTPEPFEVVWLDKNGTEHLGEVRCSLLKENGRIAGIQAIMRDVTARKEAEKTLIESEEKYRTLMDDAPVAICNIDIKGNVIYVNRRYEELSGYLRAEIIGKNALKLGMISDETLKSATSWTKTRSIGGSALHGEIQIKTRDGRWIWVDATSRLIKKWKIPASIQIILKDITGRKNAEKSLKDTLEKLKVTNEKLYVVGRLTRHDVRNKLAAIAGNIYLARQTLVGEHKALGYLKAIETASQQTKSILDFASIYEKLGVEELIYIDVKKTFEEAVLLFSDLQGIDLVNDCRGLSLLADSLLRQLLYNLVDNSLKYGEKVRTIRLHYEELDDNRLKLIYEDDGVGIPRAEKEKIFKEGYGKGTGYGLHLIRKMCEAYGWAIQESGEEGRGALFTIAIPRMNQDGKANYQLQ